MQLIDLTPQELSNTLVQINRSLDPHEIQSSYKYGPINGIKTISEQLTKRKLLNDTWPWLYTQTKSLKPEFGQALLMKTKTIKNYYDQVEHFKEIKDSSVDQYYTAINKQTQKQVLVKVIHALGQTGVRFSQNSRRQPAQIQKKAYEIFQSTLPLEFNQRIIQIQCENEPVFYVIEMPKPDNSLLNILNNKDYTFSIITSLVHDIIKQLFILHSQELALLSIKPEWIYYYQKFGFMIIDLVPYSPKLQQNTERLTGLQKRLTLQAEQLVVNYLEDTQINFKDLPQVQLNYMPPEVYLSKLNERYFYNPYKADIYNLGLMILQLLGIDSIKSSVDLYIKEMLQIYNKGDLASKKTEGQLEQVHGDLIKQVNQEMHRVKLKLFKSNILYDPFEKQIYSLRNAILDQFVCYEPQSRWNSFDLCNLMEISLLPFQVHLYPAYLNQITKQEDQQYQSKYSIIYPNGYKYIGYYNKSENQYGDEGILSDKDDIQIYKGQFSSNGMFHGRGALKLTSHPYDNIIFTGDFNHNVPIREEVFVASQQYLFKPLLKGSIQDSLYYAVETTGLQPKMLWLLEGILSYKKLNNTNNILSSQGRQTYCGWGEYWNAIAVELFKDQIKSKQ